MEDLQRLQAENVKLGEELIATQLRLRGAEGNLAALTEELRDLKVRYEKAEKKDRRVAAPQKPPLRDFVRSFGGDTQEFSFFYNEMTFALQSDRLGYDTDEETCDFILSKLTGAAKDWANSLLAQGSPALRSQAELMKTLKETFSPPHERHFLQEKLADLRQGQMGVRDYWTQFSALVSKVGWDIHSPSVVHYFFHGLRAEIKDQIISTGIPQDPEELIQAAMRVGLRQEEKRHHDYGKTTRDGFPRGFGNLNPWVRRGGEKGSHSSSHPQAAAGEEPMEIGRLSQPRQGKEGNNRTGDDLKKGPRCFVCDSPQHFARACPKRKGARETYSLRAAEVAGHQGEPTHQTPAEQLN